jgi:preprotein translocase subunit SecF
VTTVGLDAVRIQTEQLDDIASEEVRIALATAYGVESGAVTSSFIGANWGADVTEKAIIALIVFLVVVSLLMALYFRTLKMSVAALVALFHDVVITFGIYALVGFEITPAAVIGFLTILGYSLYDTVVVFDKVRENTIDVEFSETTTFASQVNLAINQTLVRSVNTSVVAVLPVASILFVGATAIGAGTLRDISLALFIGIIAGTYSSVFLAGPLYVDLRSREGRFKDKTAAAKL